MHWLKTDVNSGYFRPSLFIKKGVLKTNLKWKLIVVPIKIKWPMKGKYTDKNYQSQANIHFNGKFDVIFMGSIKSLWIKS